MRLVDVQRGIRSRVARLIGPKVVQSPSSDGYYPQQPTCQIPHLAFLFSRFLGDRTDGLFVEVGAYDGVFVSNSWGLAERGWRGLMAEPVPALAQACRTNHSNHPGVTVIERAVGPEDDRDVRLQVAGTLTTANPDAFLEFEKVDWAVGALTDEVVVVKSQRLDTLLEEHGAPEGFDLLGVDVEGFEAEVFAGFDLARWRPKMLIVELLDTHPDLLLTSRSDAELGRRILDVGYVVVFKDQINTVFVRDDVYEAAYADVAGQEVHAPRLS